MNKQKEYIYAVVDGHKVSVDIYRRSSFLWIKRCLVGYAVDVYNGGEFMRTENRIRWINENNLL